jgi:hypothetical protein
MPGDQDAGLGVVVMGERDAGAGGISDAPNDGIQYGRQLLAWTPIVAGPVGLLPANNLSDVTNVANSRSNLGLAIGINVLAYDAQLFSNIPQVSKSIDYTTIATDAQKHLFHPSADTTARTFTIASNASVPLPIGTAITFVNQHGAGALTIACADAMYQAGTGFTGNRTLAPSGNATALKVMATEWIISGTGLT